MFLIAVALLQVSAAHDEVHEVAVAPLAPLQAIPPPLMLPSISPPPSPPPVPSEPASDALPRGDPGGWVTSDDYPVIAMLLEESGRSTFQAEVDPAGRVSDCKTVVSSGFDRLDELTCKLVTRRARFTPALDASGAPMAGRYTMAVRWEIDEREPMRALDFGWKRPPEAVKRKERGTAGFEVRISDNGTIASCRITRSSGFASLDAETCNRIQASDIRSLARDDTGNPIARTVRNEISWY